MPPPRLATSVLNSLKLFKRDSLPTAFTTDFSLGATPKVSPSIILVIPPSNLFILVLNSLNALFLKVTSFPAFFNFLSNVCSK